MKKIFLTLLLYIFFVPTTDIIAEKNTLEDFVWKVGVFVCITGECAESGNNSLKGIRLALEKINAEGGVLGKKIEIVVEDTDEGRSSGAGAVTAFKKLREDPDIRYFIGPSWTPGGLSIAPIAARDKDVIVTSPSLGVADFNEAGDNIFNVWPHDKYATSFLAKYAYKRGWERIAVFSSQQPWELLQGRTFSEVFTKLGGTITSKQEPLPTTTDLRTESLKIRQSKPDAIFFSNYTQMGNASKQLRRLGFKKPFISILMSDSRIKTAEGALEDTYYAGYPEPSTAFLSLYTEKYGEEPGIGCDTSFDALNLYAEAIRKAQTFDTERVKGELLWMQYNGASGKIAFDANGGVKKKPILYQVRKGRQTLAEEDEGTI